MCVFNPNCGHSSVTDCESVTVYLWVNLQHLHELMAPMCVCVCECICVIPSSAPAEYVYFTDLKKQPQLPPALISMNQLWMGPRDAACQPSVPLLCQLFNTEPKTLIICQPLLLCCWNGAFVLLSCNSFCLQNLGALTIFFIFASISTRTGSLCLQWMLWSVY